MFKVLCAGKHNDTLSWWGQRSGFLHKNTNAVAKIQKMSLFVKISKILLGFHRPSWYFWSPIPLLYRISIVSLYYKAYVMQGTDHPRVGKINKILKIFRKSEFFWILATAFVFLCKNQERWPHHDGVSLCFPAHKTLNTEITLQLVGQYYEQYPYCTLVQTSTKSMDFHENCWLRSAITSRVLGVR